MLSSGGSDTASVTPRRSRLERALRLEWLGQTAASLCWMASMLAYGVRSSGDWLQLFAASGWLVANIAALMAVETDPAANGTPRDLVKANAADS